MKKRLHDKKAGIAILAVIFVISLADVILRATTFREIASTASNYGEALINASFSLILLVFALKGKDRVLYILCGAWLGYFVLNQLYGLPNMIETLVRCLNTANIFGSIASIAHIFSIISIVAIGVLLVEYMNDGTIYNKAFNTLCIVTVVLLMFLFFHTQNDAFSYGRPFVMLASLHELSRLAMVFLFTFFAYDSAKAQLKKTDLSK